jgi:hypothetical protein
MVFQKGTMRNLIQSNRMESTHAPPGSQRYHQVRPLCALRSHPATTPPPLHHTHPTPGVDSCPGRGEEDHKKRKGNISCKTRCTHTQRAANSAGVRQSTQRTRSCRPFFSTLPPSRATSFASAPSVEPPAI